MPVVLKKEDITDKVNDDVLVGFDDDTPNVLKDKNDDNVIEFRE